jgi:hypothetical protein
MSLLNVREVHFHLPRQQEGAALRGLLEWYRDSVAERGQAPEERVVKAGTLEKALAAFGWTVRRDASQDITGVDYQGLKYSEELEDLFEALAPFVDRGSYLRLSVDGEPYVIRFTGKHAIMDASDDVDGEDDLEDEEEE